MNQRLITTLMLSMLCASMNTSSAAVPQSDLSNDAQAADGHTNDRSADPVATPAYDKLLIDDVWIAYDESSSDRRLKPEQAARLNEAAMQAIQEAAGEGFEIVTEPGPGVLRVRAAITDIRLEEKPKRALRYTPFGFVKGRIDSATGRDLELISASVAVQLRDSMDGRQIDFVAKTVDESAEGELSFRTLITTMAGWTRQLVMELATPA